MPADALPVRRSQPNLYREYRDALGRPMEGRAVITGAQRAQDGHRVIVTAPVVAAITAGVLAVELPAGSYVIAAHLATPDGHRVDDTETIDL